MRFCCWECWPVALMPTVDSNCGSVDSVRMEQMGCIAWPWNFEQLVPSAGHMVCRVMLYSGTAANVIREDIPQSC